MGKSLSILALITKTLDDGKEWAQQQNDCPEGKEALKYSRATLVVVPSARTRPYFYLFIYLSERKPRTNFTSSHLQLDKGNRQV